MKFKLGALVTEATGKIGGMVAMGKGSGGVFRVKKSPSSKSTLLNRRRKIFFSNTVLAWRSLSVANRTLWLSTSYNGLSGWDLFLHINFNRNYLTYAILIKPVLFIKPVIIPFVSIIVNSISQQVTFTFASTLPAGIDLFILWGKPVSVGVSNVPSRMVKLTRFLGPRPLTFSSSNIYKTYFGVQVFANQKCYFQSEFMNSVTGARSELSTFFSIST